VNFNRSIYVLKRRHFRLYFYLNVGNRRNYLHMTLTIDLSFVENQEEEKL